ncbi:YbfB/YjiJ family MFS transporter [uncultured Gammaproteobacteria bacterium]
MNAIRTETHGRATIVRTALGGMLALALGLGIGRFAFTPILPAMQSAFGFGDDLAGVLAAVNHAGYLVGAIAAGFSGRWLVRLDVFRACLITSVATTALMALTAVVPVWMALRFISGVASAGLLILGSAIVLDALAAAGAAAWAGVMFGGVGIGIAGSGLAVRLLGGDWDRDWLVVAGLGLVMALPCPFWISEPRQRPLRASNSGGGVASAGISLPLVLLTLAYVCEGAGYIVTGTFLVAILKRTAETAALGEVAWIVVGLAAAPSVWLWGLLVKRRGLWATLIAAHLTQVIGILLPVLVPGPTSAIVGALLFGGTFMAICGQALTLGRQLAPVNPTAAISVLTIAFSVGQIVGPVIAGMAMARTGGYDWALSFAAAVVLAGAGLLGLGQRQSQISPEPDLTEPCPAAAD